MKTKERAGITIITCILVCGAIAYLGLSIGMKTIIPGPASLSALQENPGEQLAFASGIPRRDSLTIILRNEHLQSTAQRFEEAKQNLVSILQRLNLKSAPSTPLFPKIQSAGIGLLDGEKFISADEHSMLIHADSSVRIDFAKDELSSLPDIFSRWQGEFKDFRLWYLSSGTVDSEMFALIERDLDHSLIYTIPITLFILLWVFGSIAAALLPIIVALVSLITSLGLASIYSNLVLPVSATASQLSVLLVLAIGVDYSLFIISRVREEVLSGLSYLDSINIALRSAGKASFFSGITVALSLIGLLLMQDHILTSMAVVSLLSVIVTVAITLILLPAILRLIEKNLEYGSLFRAKTNSGSSLALKLLTLSLRYPVVSAISAIVMCIALALPFSRISLGSTVHPSLLPASTQSYLAYQELARTFPKLAGTDISMIVELPGGSLESGDHLEDLVAEFVSTGELHGPIANQRSDDGRVQRYQFVSSVSANQDSAKALIDRFRNETRPNFKLSSGGDAFLTGTLPFEVDEARNYVKETPIVYMFVMAISALFLLFTFRSLVIPIKAIILNLLSTVSAFGFMVLLFQPSPFSLWNFGIIESFVPALLFSILFGLSMDYHIFLISRVKEEVDKGFAPKIAVQKAVMSSSRSITGAAMIMVSVFAVIATLELPIMKQLGVGLAFAVFLDATLIRSVLLPASLVLLGKWNWYWPFDVKVRRIS